MQGKSCGESFWLSISLVSKLIFTLLKALVAMSVLLEVLHSTW